jgi:hypothetical protein
VQQLGGAVHPERPLGDRPVHLPDPAGAEPELVERQPGQRAQLIGHARGITAVAPGYTTCDLAL